jgi:hypothetical protein
LRSQKAGGLRNLMLACANGFMTKAKINREKQLA